MGAKTPLPRWRIMTTCWTSAHRPQTIWNQKADDWDSWEITLLPLHQPIRRKSTSCNLTPNVFKTLPLKAIWEFGPCEHKLPVLLDRCPPTSAHTRSPLHTNLKVANFQRRECVFTCPIMEVRSRVWCPLSCVCILYKWLCFCVLYCTVLYRVGFPGGSAIKNPPTMQEMRIWSLGQEEPLEEEMAPTPVLLPGAFHGQEQTTVHGVTKRHNWVTKQQQLYRIQ